MTIREWVQRLWGTLRRHPDHEWQEELRLHLELAAEDARRRGHSPDDAARAARLRAGSIPQAIEALHDQRGLPWVEDLARDLRHGLLAFKRNPAFTTVAVLTLALGVGANSAIFSVVYAVLLRPLPYHEPDRLVSAGSMLAGEYLFLRDHMESLGEMALYRANVGFNLSHIEEPERVAGAYVSANLFSTLGISAITGRTLRAAEEQPGESAVVVLSHALWRQRFGADAGIIGRDVLIDSEPRRVVGVMPPTFNFPSANPALGSLRVRSSQFCRPLGVVGSAARSSPGSPHKRRPRRPRRSCARERQGCERRIPSGYFPLRGVPRVKWSCCKTASWATCVLGFSLFSARSE